jgi:hypothetical protein
LAPHTLNFVGDHKNRLGGGGGEEKEESMIMSEGIMGTPFESLVSIKGHFGLFVCLFVLNRRKEKGGNKGERK